MYYSEMILVTVIDFNSCNLSFIYFQILMNVTSGMGRQVVVVPMLNAQTPLEALDASASLGFQEMRTSNV
jgi:hypothetical protein